MTTEEKQALRAFWHRLVSNGTAQEDLGLAQRILPGISVVVDDWVARLSQVYLQDLCQFSSHTKLVIGQYGSGKTHFLLLLAARALKENYAVAFVKCREGVSLDNSLVFFQEIAKTLTLPNSRTSGIRALFQLILELWRSTDAANPDLPDPAYAMEQRLQEMEISPEIFLRVSAAYLRSLDNPAANRDLGRAAAIWFNDPKAITAKDRQLLRVSGVTKIMERDLGNELRHSLTRLLPQAGLHGLVLLVDESESMFSARGKALARVLQAMRTLVDTASGGSDSIPCLTVFAAVTDIDEKIKMFPALDQRFSVSARPFHEGNTSAPRIELEHLGKPEVILDKIGSRLTVFAEIALEVSFDRTLQAKNQEAAVSAVLRRKVDADSRRLFVKTWCGLLDEQKREGERTYTLNEMEARVAGVVDQISTPSAEEEDYA